MDTGLHAPPMGALPWLWELKRGEELIPISIYRPPLHNRPGPRHAQGPLRVGHSFSKAAHCLPLPCAFSEELKWPESFWLQIQSTINLLGVSAGKPSGPTMAFPSRPLGSYLPELPGNISHTWCIPVYVCEKLPSSLQGSSQAKSRVGALCIRQWDRVL